MFGFFFLQKSGYKYTSLNHRLNAPIAGSIHRIEMFRWLIFFVHAQQF
jgi:hypothetical protein